MTAPANYSEAVGGLRIESSIAPRAVSALVAGGVPPSRLPRLLAMLLASAGVLVAALMIVRRERQLADLRSDFVSGVSHELRTPLSEIRMFSETLLLDRIRTPAERQRSLQIINEEARRLENLVNNVLFFTRSNGAHRPLTGDCDMETLVSGTIDAFAPLATRRGVVVTAEVPSGLRAPVDEEAWRQVLTNILDNAVKYGPPGQTVRVRVTAPDPRLRMEVEDEGPGIPPSEREAVWRRFHRLERDRLTHNAGCGIGLAIVRTIVDRHGGRCWIEEANGGGARFVVEVPLSAEARATTAPARQAETTT
ncbi:MAG TPA: HAMP domain-containing sensor histidine kinase [Thermoanaerobaculia bacterium]|nr:HAMP domain-containing sensor histidine kinase [Thermoanaerobaculia bacterium]